MIAWYVSIRQEDKLRAFSRACSLCPSVSMSISSLTIALPAASTKQQQHSHFSWRRWPDWPSLNAMLSYTPDLELDWAVGCRQLRVCALISRIFILFNLFWRQPLRSRRDVFHTLCSELRGLHLSGVVFCPTRTNQGRKGGGKHRGFFF